MAFMDAIRIPLQLDAATEKYPIPEGTGAVTYAPSIETKRETKRIGLRENVPDAGSIR